MGARAGKTGVYLAILVAIIVVILVVTTRGGKPEEDEQIQVGGVAVATETYAEWAQGLDNMIQNESPEGVDTVGPMRQVTVFEPSNRQNIRFDPFSGTGLRDAGWVTDASADAKGNWRVDIDIDAPGTAADGAEMHIIVPKRYTAGEPPPASGTKLSFFGAIQEWEYHKGHKTQVWLKDASILKR